MRERNQAPAWRSSVGIIAMVAGAVSAVPGMSTAQAQTVSDGTATDGGARPDDIIVTATRRETRLEDTPLSITALGEDTLTALGADGVAGFARSAPGLTFNQANAGRGSFAIRGISTGVLDGDNQATVALYIDELPTDDARGSRAFADLSLFDVQRVEVLRGPQGTLFGSGALGGAIRVLTNKPALDEVEGRALVDYWLTDGGKGSYALKGMVNMPIVTGRVAVRAVGYYRYNGGWVDNVTTGSRNVNDDTTYGGRLSIKADVTERFSITASAIFQKMKVGESALLDRVDGRFVRKNPLESSMTTEGGIFNLNAEYDLGWANLMSSTTVNRKKTDVVNGYEQGYGDLPLSIRGPDKGHGFAQEVRLSSSGKGAFHWVVGAFYFERDRKAVSLFESPGNGPLLGLDNDILLDARIRMKDKERALYGEASYAPTARLELTAGLRLFRNTATYRDIQSGPLAGGGTVATGPVRNDESKVTPKFVIAYKPASETLVYLSAAQGYRIGGTNVPNALDPAVPLAYKPDSLWNYEAGIKTSAFDRRLTVNAAVYHIDWKNIQIERTAINDIGYQDNGGKATSTGVEVELTARPVRGLVLTSAASINRTRSSETVAGTNIVKGDRLPGARKYTISSSIEYQATVGEGLEGFARADHQYVSSAYSDFSNAVAAIMPSYHLVNVRVGLAGSHWRAAFYATNLFDNHRLSLVGTLGDAGYRLKPRTVGISLETNF